MKRKTILLFLLLIATVFTVSLKNQGQIFSASTNGNIKSSNIASTVEYNRLFSLENKHQFKIVMTQDEWDGLSEDMIQYNNQYHSLKTGAYRKADVYYSDDFGEQFIGEVAIRTKGNTTRVIPEDNSGLHRFHFKLKFNNTFDLEKDSTEYYERDNRKFAELQELNFKWNFSADNTCIREVFSYNLLNEVGVDTSNAALTTVVFEVDGQAYDYGVYSIIEPIDTNFLTKRFGQKSDSGDLYKCLWQHYGPATLEPITDSNKIGIKNWETNYRPTYDLKTNKSENDNKDLLDFIEKLNTLEGEDIYEYLEENFDVDSFLKYQAMGVLLGMPDDYWAMGNNYFLYFNNHGKITFIPYDYDNCLGAGWDGDPGWTYDGIANADIYEWKNLNSAFLNQTVNHPLVEKIMSVQKYRDKYKKYLETFIDPSNNYFTYDRFNDLFDEMYSIYKDDIDNVMNEGGEMTLNNELWYFETKINSVKTQLEEVDSNAQ